MQTVTDHIQSLANDLQENIRELIEQHAALYLAYGPGSGVFSQ